ncbi:hypothetical protein RRG08_023357 [Elysia crispata]|uniref:Uncharacterized protein n=1 Tax=Elysia crispata TaxID=231223 RepID=A0AAE1EDM4_9GAST|nr:hypothetical protein RRG08_023357 [Elysia crispata]
MSQNTFGQLWQYLTTMGPENLDFTSIADFKYSNNEDEEGTSLHMERFRLKDPMDFETRVCGGVPDRTVMRGAALLARLAGWLAGYLDLDLARALSPACRGQRQPLSSLGLPWQPLWPIQQGQRDKIELAERFDLSR